MNRARRRGIENEQKGPSCLDRNAKIIGRALSTGLQETMTGRGGRSKDVPSPFDCPCPVERHGATVSRHCRGQTRDDVISRKNRLAGFSTKMLLYLSNDSSKQPLPLGSHVADSSVIGEKSRPIC